MLIPIVPIICALLVFGLLFWLVRWLVPQLGLPAPIGTVLYVILVVLFVLWLINLLGGFSGHYGSVRIG